MKNEKKNSMKNTVTVVKKIVGRNNIRTNRKNLLKDQYVKVVFRGINGNFLYYSRKKFKKKRKKGKLNVGGKLFKRTEFYRIGYQSYCKIRPSVVNTNRKMKYWLNTGLILLLTSKKGRKTGGEHAFGFINIGLIVRLY